MLTKKEITGQETPKTEKIVFSVLIIALLFYMGQDLPI